MGEWAEALTSRRIPFRQAYGAAYRAVHSLAAVSGPADLGKGTWPGMRFTHLQPSERAACEFVQEVVRELEARLSPRDQVQRHHLPSRRELARRANVDPDTLNDLLLGQTWPRLDRLVRIT